MVVKMIKSGGVVIIFLLGILIGSFYQASALEMPFSISGMNSDNSETAMPKDRIDESKIKVYSDRVIIEIDNPKWAKFADTNSMTPFLDKGANAIQITPESAQDIEVGDIISYESLIVDSTIIHRVLEIDEDEEGIYFIMKGDNNLFKDPEKVRFAQVKKVLVGIIY